MAEPYRYEGWAPDEWQAALGVPRLDLLETVRSTQDVAHALAAAGAPPGSVVLADRQTAGRGRGGRAWASEPGAGVWLTLLERPGDPAALEVLAIRLGLAAARALDAFAAERVRVKWPNDLFVGAGKLAGLLVETRWRGDRPDWTAVGVGVNVRAPAAVPEAGALISGARRREVVLALVPAVRAAVGAAGPLNADEMREFAARDYAEGRVCRSPAAGRVLGITAQGGLVIGTARGEIVARTGSLVLEDAPTRRGA